MMNRIRKSNFAGYTLALLPLFIAMAPSAIAKHKPETPADSVTVVAHLPLPGGSVSQIFIHGHGDKQYLYIQQASEEGFGIVEVTNPYRPNVVNRVNLLNKEAGKRCRWSERVWPSPRHRAPERKTLALNLRRRKEKGHLVVALVSSQPNS
jgi:hypothetical protein